MEIGAIFRDRDKRCSDGRRFVRVVERTTKEGDPAFKCRGIHWTPLGYVDFDFLRDTVLKERTLLTKWELTLGVSMVETSNKAVVETTGSEQK